jgi:zinc transport system substrate-binding protein
MIIIFMKTVRRVVGLTAVAAFLLVATACAGPAQPSGSDTSERGPLQILAAFYPFQFVAERVAGDHAEVTNLTEPGAEPHDLELKPRQVASIAAADLVIYERTFQPAVDEAVAQAERDPQNVLDTATVVPLVDHGLEEEEEHAGEEHAEHGLDPHVWLDPIRLATIVGAVADRLAAIDATHAADYRANAANLDAQLRDLDGTFRTGLAHCRRTEFVTAHAAFGYLAERYGLTQIGISGLSPDAEPSPARIAAVQREARARGITTIFYETLVSPAVAKSIAGDLGLKVDVLDPIEGIVPTSKGSDYLSVMAANLTALREANGCR